MINTNKYKYTTKDIGSSDHGICEWYFTLKTDDELLKEKRDNDLKYQIDQIEKKFNVKLNIENENI